MRSRRASSLLFALSGIFQLSCSSTDTTPRDKPSPGLQAPAASKGLQLGFTVKALPGSEIVACRELIVPGDAAIEVGRIEHVSTPGTHHVHAYRTGTPADKVSPEPFNCGDLAGPLFYATQKDAESTHFQPGVGVKLAGGEVVRLELHYLNTSNATIEADLRLNLWFAEQQLSAEAGSFLMYDHAIDVPPHGATTTRMHCEIPADITMTSLLPHVHTHGKAERIYLGGKGLGLPRLLVDSKGYGDLEARAFDDAPIAVKAGQALDFECDFENGSDHALVEGTSPTTAEMCVLMGSYYPRLPAAAEWCTLPGSGPVP